MLEVHDWLSLVLCLPLKTLDSEHLIAVPSHFGLNNFEYKIRPIKDVSILRLNEMLLILEPVLFNYLLE